MGFPYDFNVMCKKGFLAVNKLLAVKSKPFLVIIAQFHFDNDSLRTGDGIVRERFNGSLIYMTYSGALSSLKTALIARQSRRFHVMIEPKSQRIKKPSRKNPMKPTRTRLHRIFKFR